MQPDECIICLDESQEILHPRCGCVFNAHTKCILVWLRHKNECPYCHRPTLQRLPEPPQNIAEPSEVCASVCLLLVLVWCIGCIVLESIR
jgi:hypothetical protein